MKKKQRKDSQNLNRSCVCGKFGVNVILPLLCGFVEVTTEEMNVEMGPVTGLAKSLLTSEHTSSCVKYQY